MRNYLKSENLPLLVGMPLKFLLFTLAVEHFAKDLATCC